MALVLELGPLIPGSGLLPQALQSLTSLAAETLRHVGWYPPIVAWWLFGRVKSMSGVARLVLCVCAGLWSHSKCVSALLYLPVALSVVAAACISGFVCIHLGMPMSPNVRAHVWVREAMALEGSLCS